MLCGCLPAFGFLFRSLSSQRAPAVSISTQQRDSVSPTLNIIQEDVGLPHGEVIPDEYKEMTESWVQVRISKSTQIFLKSYQ